MKPLSKRMTQSVWLSVKIPGVSLLVFLRDEEPDEISVTQPPLLIHSSVPDGKQTKLVLKLAVETR